MAKEHNYAIHLDWVGNRGEGTKSYSSYERLYKISLQGKQSIEGSSDPNFRGDASKYNPEEMLLMSLSGCHMLWYLHLCSVNKICVEAYVDSAEGNMTENPDGSGEFSEVILKPRVTISRGDLRLAEALHHKANQMCFIARSVNFPIKHKTETLSS